MCAVNLLDKNEVAVCVDLYVSPDPMSLANTSLSMSPPCCLHYHISVVQPEIRDCDTMSRLVCLLVFWDYLGHPTSFVFPYEFWDYFSISMKYCIGILIGIELNVHWLWKYGHFHSISPVNPRVWKICLSFGVLFSFVLCFFEDLIVQVFTSFIRFIS